jgi:hypothetical protein
MKHRIVALVAVLALLTTLACTMTFTSDESRAGPPAQVVMNSTLPMGYDEWIPDAWYDVDTGPNAQVLLQNGFQNSVFKQTDQISAVVMTANDYAKTADITANGNEYRQYSMAQTNWKPTATVLRL